MVKKYLCLNNVLLALALMAFAGGLVYRLYALDTAGTIAALILAVALFWAINRFFPPAEKSEPGRYSLSRLPASILCLLFIAGAFYILARHGTDAPIVSPWQTVPFYFFFLFLAAILTAHALAVKSVFPAWLGAPLYFLFFSVAAVVYRIGYGFDPFIHQATAKLIAAAGAVSPKPFYYLGQYALVTIVHKLTALPVETIDRWLVPGLAAALLPFALARALKGWLSDKPAALAVIPALLILPVGLFIMTAPQNLSYLFLLLIIILGLRAANYHDLFAIYALATAALLTQPIAGLPAFFFALGLTIYHSGLKFKKILYIFLFAAAAGAPPFAFHLLESRLAVAAPPAAPSVSAGPALAFPGSESALLNLVYLYGFNIEIVLCLLAAAGLVFYWRHRRDAGPLFLYALLAAACGLAWLLSRRLPFSFLIAYEQDYYAGRLAVIAALFLFPFFVLALYALVRKIRIMPAPVSAVWLFFLAVIATISLYLAYPRFDNYHNSRGYSTGLDDIEAVRWIEADAAGADYVVLANQQVAAAALKEFGFKKYYQSENEDSQIFYYPIPTGGPLYRYYLDMVYKSPSRATALAAMDLAGVKTAYFVLNKYWWAFPKIRAEAALAADAQEEIDNGAVIVFKYQK